MDIYYSQNSFKKIQWQIWKFKCVSDFLLYSLLYIIHSDNIWIKNGLHNEDILYCKNNLIKLQYTNKQTKKSQILYYHNEDLYYHLILFLRCLSLCLI